MRPRALISVSDKQGVVELGRALAGLGYEIVSTGGTASLLVENGLTVTAVEDATGFPECMDGRVKTLHPGIMGGILAVRDIESHQQTLCDFSITPIDIVAVNLYPFREATRDPAHTLEQAIEKIDIGGPSMIRAAAKNYKYVAVVTEPGDYAGLVTRLREGRMDEAYRFELAVKAFGHTASYDAYISGYLNKLAGFDYPDALTLTFDKRQSLRYGENPHQSAAYYVRPGVESCGIEQARVLHGKELSYNNINDAQGAIALAQEFDEPVCVAVKHATPCGVGVGGSVYEAYVRAYEGDPVSIFGGIVCVNREVDEAAARKMNEIFLDVIIAPGYTDEALAVLTTKKNVRLLVLPEVNKRPAPAIEYKYVGGGLLAQQADAAPIDGETHTLVTKAAPSAQAVRDLLFAFKVVKHVKSNGIVVAKDGRTLGIGGGQVNRIWPAEAALARAGEACSGAVLASDGFFPFDDVVTACLAHGIQAIIQPGGSKNDKLSIELCNEHGIAMLFSGVRHFRH